MKLAHLLFPVFCIAALGSGSAQAQDTGDRFYQAIRGDDIARVRVLATPQAVNTPDSHGTTPLMYAAATGSIETMKLLLDRGADPNVKNAFGATALMWAAGDIGKVRLLLAKGADLNARSNFGRTPLMLAALHDGSHEIAKLLIDRGADVSACDKTNFCVLQAAAQGNDTATVRLVLAHGAGAKDGTARTGGRAVIGSRTMPKIGKQQRGDSGTTALMIAAMNGNLDVANLLLAKGSDVNAVTAQLFQVVKNGPIELGLFTPLLCATPYGPPEMLKLLIDAGANVNARDARGMTPLMLAIATDRPDPRIIRLLLAKGADASLRSKRGETALDWANKFRNPEVFRALGMKMPVIQPVPVAKRKSIDPKSSVEKSVALLQSTSNKFVSTGGCISCHAQNLTGMAVNVARANGATVDGKLDAEVARSTVLFHAGGEQMFLQLVDPPGAVHTMEYSVLHLGASHIAASRALDAIVLYIAAGQREAGNWPYAAGGVPRPPIEDGDFFSTAMGIRILQIYGIPGRRAEFQDRIRRAGAWLKSAKPLSTEDRAMQLLGLRWAGLQAQTRVEELLAMQREDGGWAQTPWLQSDAYATGQVLDALHEAGVPASNQAYARGVAYLQSTQGADGSWHVTSRAPKFQPYFQSGFPYDDDQWISMAGTAWAAMGMAYAIPVVVADAHR